MPKKKKVSVRSTAQKKPEDYVLRLYISGVTSRSVAAVNNIRDICETQLHGRYDLQVIDIYQQPELVSSAQIVAVPTLIKRLPLPLRQIVGDLSEKERVLVGLGLRVKNDVA